MGLLSICLQSLLLLKHLNNTAESFLDFLLIGSRHAAQLNSTSLADSKLLFYFDFIWKLALQLQHSSLQLHFAHFPTYLSITSQLLLNIFFLQLFSRAPTRFYVLNPTWFLAFQVCKDIGVCLVHAPTLFLYKNQESYKDLLHYLALLLLLILQAFLVLRFMVFLFCLSVKMIVACLHAFLLSIFVIFSFRT